MKLTWKISLSVSLAMLGCAPADPLESPPGAAASGSGGEGAGGGDATGSGGGAATGGGGAALAPPGGPCLAGDAAGIDGAIWSHEPLALGQYSLSPGDIGFDAEGNAVFLTWLPNAVRLCDVAYGELGKVLFRIDGEGNPSYVARVTEGFDKVRYNSLAVQASGDVYTLSDTNLVKYSASGERLVDAFIHQAASGGIVAATPERAAFAHGSLQVVDPDAAPIWATDCGDYCSIWGVGVLSDGAVAITAWSRGPVFRVYEPAGGVRFDRTLAGIGDFGRVRVRPGDDIDVWSGQSLYRTGADGQPVFEVTFSQNGPSGDQVLRRIDGVDLAWERTLSGVSSLRGLEADGERLLAWGVVDGPFALDGSMLTEGDRGTFLAVFDLATGELDDVRIIDPFPALKEPLLDAALGPDGRIALAVSYGESERSVFAVFPAR
jgi:hypothetical protein